MDEKIYKIGDYEFETLREYRQAQEDLKKIKYITDELDIYDPEVAIRLYTMMRTKKIRFKSEIGKSFFWCISDIVADSSQNMIEEKIAKEEAEAEAKLPFHFTWQKVVGIVCIIVATACIGYYAISEYADYKAANRLKDLQNKKQNNVVEHLVTGTEQMNPEITEDATETGETTEQPLIMLEDYVSLYAENPELIGWLHIPDTDIDYPVMQGAALTTYMNLDINRNYSYNGSLWVDTDINDASTNTVIFGHNWTNVSGNPSVGRSSDVMFAQLPSFAHLWFAQRVPYFYYSSTSQDMVWQVFAAFYTTDLDFYLYTTRTGSALQSIIDKGRSLSLHHYDVNVSSSDRIITLSTCTRALGASENQRFVVMAKLVSSGDANVQVT